MGYERTLLTRWTRRDWLAIAVIALTTAFLVGSSVMILATGSQIDDEVKTLNALETAAFADAAAGGASDGDVTLPVAEATTANGTNVTVVGLPDATVHLTSSFDEATLSSPPPDGVVERGRTDRSTIRLSGVSGNATLSVRDASNRSMLPERWYSTRRSTVRELGRTGHFQLETGSSADAANTSGLPGEGTLLLGTPGFLIIGGSEIVELLGLMTLASGLLVGVTVYSVTRMTVRDRRRTLFVVRSTGGTRRRLVGLFGVRAALLTAVGAAFGYAIGIILINAVLNGATYYGTLTTLDVSGSPTDRLVLGAMLVTILGIGLIAGALSVVRTAAAPPASLMGTGAGVGRADGLASRVREALGVDMIGIRTVVPMTAALTVLIAIAIVSVSIALALAPLAGATDGVIMSPDASYPLQSQVDQKLVESFRESGIPASPEILLPQVRNGQPYVMRGVNYSAYRRVSGVRVSAGWQPTAMDEALIGEGLARTLDVEVGDTITVGGGTAFGLDRVTVVGRFGGRGYLDDQLLITLGTAKQLANTGEDSVQIIRTTGVEEPPNPGNAGSPPTPADIVVTDVSVPETGIVNRNVPVEVTLRNRGEQTGTRTLAVPVNGIERETSVTVDGNRTRTVTRNAVFRELGTYTITIAGMNASVTIEPTPANITVTNVTAPDMAFVNRDVSISVNLSNRGGQAGALTLGVPVDGGVRETTVAVNGSREVITANGSEMIVDDNGGQKRTVTLTARFNATGTYNLTVGGAETPIRIVEPQPANITVTNVAVPERGFVGKNVSVNVTLRNRGDLPGSRTLTVPVNGIDSETTVTVRGGETRNVTLTAVYQTPGVYNLTIDDVVSDDQPGESRVVTQATASRAPGAHDFVGDIEIVEPDPANISVTDVTVPETGAVNFSVPVEVTLENRGDLAGNRTLAVSINGTDSEPVVTVGGRRTRTVTLSPVFESTGVYNITVEGMEYQVDIGPSAPADIVVTNVSVPETALTGENVSVNVTLRNRGDIPGNRTLSVPVNGTERETNVTVVGREERTVTLVAAYRTSGDYTITMGEAGAAIRINAPADVVVTNVSVPALGCVRASLTVNVTLRNRGNLPGSRTLSVPVNGTERTTEVTLNGSQERTVTLNASFRTPGAYVLPFGAEDTRIRIVRPGNLSLDPLPARAPPGETLLVTARDRTDAEVSGLRFRLGEDRARTGPNGTARIQVPGKSGEYRLESVIGERIIHNRSLKVDADANRSVLATLRVRPEEVSFPNEVEAIVTAYNPWGKALSRELVVRRDGEAVSRLNVSFSGGERRRITTSLEPAIRDGTQQLRVVSDGAVLGTATFTFEIPDRLLAMLARLGLYQPGSGLQQSLESLIGNIQVLQISLVVLAFLVGVGNTGTVIVQATHARRRTIGIRRVTGASPWDVVWMLLGDGLRVGTVSSVIGVVSAYLSLTMLVEVGYAVIFGVRIPPLLNPWLVAGVFGGVLVVTATSSVIAAWWVVRVSPGALMTASTRRVPDRDDGKPTPGPEVDG